MSQHDSQLVSQTRSSGVGEVPFEPGGMFYSRTDERGVIIEGNSVFRRISGYMWEELKGAPHKVVRHPDMPKGVFQLYWDKLKAGDYVSYLSLTFVSLLNTPSQFQLVIPMQFHEHIQ